MGDILVSGNERLQQDNQVDDAVVSADTLAQDRTDMANERNELASQRNTLAQGRTVLANERTYQAWLRTGLAGMASGMGTAKFLKDVMPMWALVTVSSLLMLFSIVAFLQSSWRYSHLYFCRDNLDVGVMSVLKAKVISYTLAGCSLIALFGILVTIGEL